jgi:hypothetical protein
MFQVLLMLDLISMFQMKHLDFEINDLESRFLCQKEVFETLMVKPI